MGKNKGRSRRRRPRRRRPRRTRFRRGTISSNMKRKSNKPQQGNVMRMTPNSSDAFSLGSEVDIEGLSKRENEIFKTIEEDREKGKNNNSIIEYNNSRKLNLKLPELIIGGDISKRLKNRKSRNKRRSRTARGKKIYPQ